MGILVADGRNCLHVVDRRVIKDGMRLDSHLRQLSSYLFLGISVKKTSEHDWKTYIDLLCDIIWGTVVFYEPLACRGANRLPVYVCTKFLCNTDVQPGVNMMRGKINHRTLC